MKYKCQNQDCNNSVKEREYYCKRCLGLREKHVIKSLEIYLSENFQFKENFKANYPYKIVEHQRLKHGVSIGGYSQNFINMFNGHLYEGIEIESICQSILKMKQANLKLYDSLTMLWGNPINMIKCHRSTAYRRLYRALKFIASDIGLMKLI